VATLNAASFVSLQDDGDIAPGHIAGFDIVAPIFAPVSVARERWSGHTSLPRHRHEQGYLCVVLSGSYEEAGDGGRRIVRAGDVLCHGPFDAHCDQFMAVGAETLNLRLPHFTEFADDFCRVRDPDLIVRTAERNHDEARELLLSMLEPVHSVAQDWPDILAADIQQQPELCLGTWANGHGLAPATLSRGFRRVYGISCIAYRAQLRARRAWRSLVNGALPLSLVAQDSGFADQAHMTRAIAALTGCTPLHWRRLASNGFNTQGRHGRTLAP
jgi:AraC-like DNA-binding protein